MPAPPSENGGVFKKQHPFPEGDATDLPANLSAAVGSGGGSVAQAFWPGKAANARRTRFPAKCGFFARWWGLRCAKCLTQPPAIPTPARWGVFLGHFSIEKFVLSI